MVNVNVTGGEMSQAEINSYIDRAQKLYPEKTIQTIDLKIDGDFVDVDYHFADVPFQRIRTVKMKHGICHRKSGICRIFYGSVLV